jgi:hypothetical protein
MTGEVDGCGGGEDRLLGREIVVTLVVLLLLLCCNTVSLSIVVYECMRRIRVGVRFVVALHLREVVVQTAQLQVEGLRVLRQT